MGYPVLIRRVAMEDLRVRPGPLKNTVLYFGEKGIRPDRIASRKNLTWHRSKGVLIGRLEGRCEAIIQSNPFSSRHIDMYPVADAPPLLIFVEPLINKIPQIFSAL